jgi:hypothetical protein
MDKATIRIAVGLRIGVPIVRPHVCVCGTPVIQSMGITVCHVAMVLADIHVTTKSTICFAVLSSVLGRLRHGNRIRSVQTMVNGRMV